MTMLSGLPANQYHDPRAAPGDGRHSRDEESARTSVLIVDDDVELGSMMRAYLERDGIDLSMQHSGALGLAAASTGEFDLILLDVMLPDMDGLEVLQRLRAGSDLSVLLLSACGQPADRIRGLQLGADDYLSKPFDPDELVARIRAVMRRSRAPLTQSPRTRRQIRLHGLVVDRGTRSAWYKATMLCLTDIEFALLNAMFESPGIVLTREHLSIGIFERELHPLNRNLDMHISRLRKKLHVAGVPGNPIRSIRGSGYLFSMTVLQSPGLASE